MKHHKVEVGHKSVGVKVNHLKVLKRKAVIKTVLHGLYWFGVGALGVLFGKLLVYLY